MPKKWQKFDDLLLIPAGGEITDNLEDLAEKYQGFVIRLLMHLVFFDGGKSSGSKLEKYPKLFPPLCTDNRQ